MQVFQLKTKPEFGITEDYKVVWMKTGTTLKPQFDKDGYKYYCYRIQGKNYSLREHRGVAEIFVDNPKPSKYRIINHKDSDVTNNHPSNLEWCDHQINRAHAQVVGRHRVKGEDHSQTKITEELAHKICKLVESGLTPKDVAEICNVERHYISNIKAGKSWRHVSENYNIKVPKKDCFSKSTLKWVEFQIQSGRSDKEIIEQSVSLDEAKLIKIIKVIREGV
jgi:plasmid maintenance system antidote protein VapI